jgi:hypothetical protein
VLELRPNCECCDKDLAPDALDAMICTFECTFCALCAEGTHKLVCPNCGGDLQSRPTRPDRLLGKYPPSTKRVVKKAVHLDERKLHGGPYRAVGPAGQILPSRPS